MERALGAGWKAQPFGKHPADFEVTSERAAFTVREAWNAVYRLREQQGIQRAESCFAVPANQAAGARGVKFTAAGAMIAPKELSLALNNCEWSVEQVKARAAWTYSGDQGRPKQGEGTVVVPDAGSREWQVLLTTEDSDLAPDPMPIEISTRDRITIAFSRPGAVILRGPAFAA